MRDTYTIKDKNSGLKVSVLPDYGGMVSGISLGGKELLYLDERTVESSPITAGGIPILFPFAGKTAKDSYIIDGKKYHMPMHGLVKNICFAVESHKENEIWLYTDGSKAFKDRHYPFDYTLKAGYIAEGTSVHIREEITNHSEKSMPHSIGWHPYFKTTDKTKLSLEHFMTVHYDYTERKDEEAKKSIDLSRSLDHVYTMPEKAEFTFTNEADRYEVQCMTASEYRTFVIYNGKEGSTCIEPWCGLPDSANSGRMLEWIGPSETKRYEWEMKIRLL